MTRTLIVIREPATVVADLVHTAVECDPRRLSHIRHRFWLWLRLPIGRPQRAHGKQTQDIGEEQFLVLLLVIDAQID